MTIIKNAILSPIQRLIGIAPSPSPTVIDDDAVSLTFPVVPDIARRSVLPSPNAGWFQGILENVHSGADAESSGLFPFAAGPDAVAPYPAAISEEFDLWLLKVGGIRTVGTGDLTAAYLILTPPAHSQGFGHDDAGAPVVTNLAMKIAFFSALEETGGTSLDPFITPSGDLFVDINMRLPRGCTLIFNSESAAAAEYQMWFILGLFPAALGQDVVT